MAYTQRKQEILKILKDSDKALSIDALCAKIFVSRSTLRRDLIQMENEGLIVRHFGAVSLAQVSSKENTATFRSLENREKKSLIAKLTSSMLHDNMVLFLDSSSTVSFLIPYLSAHENITVITNGINVALNLNSCHGVNCYLCPGLVKHNSFSIIGEYTSLFLDNFRADIAFISCKAISPSGLFEGDDAQAIIKRHMMQNAEKTIALCDSTKSSCSGFFLLTDFKRIDTVVTDAPFPKEIVSNIESSGCRLITGH